ncbi:phage tail protein [Pseudomonas sp. S75]|uniref:phage tail protein n=1 Tax=unclassified Pseudomonas TaxID=196821 RepID=UPI00190368C9|nr:MULTISPECIES: phage tail protein [unclassified Pseudomonas]MBJ9977810.1 phage tail protein [Pseudomonas sp. S30]MBK0155409.1 phage tail protein [Pseudomonas sp. S75]
MSRADELAALERGMAAVRGLGNRPLTRDKILGEHETGVVLVDASAGNLTITLPRANKIMDVRVQRVDNALNRLVIQAAGGETIRFHTRLRAGGYPFFVLIGADDFWHLRSDAAGGWQLMDRLDTTSLGRCVFETTTVLNPGGWQACDGRLFDRQQWPWLWDHAQQSGMLVAESERTGMEGAWSRGDGTSNLRIPDLRSEFLRCLDEGRGIHPDRRGGALQRGTRFAYGGGAKGIGALGAWWSDSLYQLEDADEFVQLPTPANGGAIYPAGTNYQNNTSDMLFYEYRPRPRNIGLPARIKLI